MFGKLYKKMEKQTVGCSVYLAKSFPIQTNFQPISL